MASSIKLFQNFQQIHQFIGIHPPQPNQKKFSLNTRNKCLLICEAQLVFTTVSFTVFDAKSMFDYGLAVLVAVSICHGVVFYLVFIWKLEIILDVIENIEEFIGKRMYCKCSQFQCTALSPKRAHVMHFVYFLIEKKFTFYSHIHSAWQFLALAY